MTETDLISLSQALDAVVRRIARAVPSVHPGLWEQWSQVAGPHVARRTFPKELRGKTLYVAVNNSTWMQQLVFAKPALLERIAACVGPDVIREVRFVVDERIDADTTAPPPCEAVTPPPDIHALPPDLQRAAAGIDDADLGLAVLRAAARCLAKRRS